MSDHDPVAVRVAATVALVERVTPLVIETCQRLTAEACARCGVTLAEWRAMTFDQREMALRASRRRRKKKRQGVS